MQASILKMLSVTGLTSHTHTHTHLQTMRTNANGKCQESVRAYEICLKQKRKTEKTNNKIQTICGHINLYVPRPGGEAVAPLQVPGHAVGLEKIGKQNHVG